MNYSDYFLILKLLKYIIYLPLRRFIHSIQFYIFGIKFGKNSAVIFDKILFLFLAFKILKVGQVKNR